MVFLGRFKTKNSRGNKERQKEVTDTWTTMVPADIGIIRNQTHVDYTPLSGWLANPVAFRWHWFTDKVADGHGFLRATL